MKFGDEQNAIVRTATRTRVCWRKLDSLALVFVVVSHLDLRHRVTQVQSKGSLSGVLSLEIDIGHAVDRKERGDMLRHFVLHDRTFEQDTPYWSEFLEKRANLELGDSIGEPRHEKVGLLLS